LIKPRASHWITSRPARSQGLRQERNIGRQGRLVSLAFSCNNVCGWKDALVQASGAGGARPQRRSRRISVAKMSFEWSTGLRSDGNDGAKLVAENNRKTAEIARPGSDGDEIPAAFTIRKDLLSSIAISWSCRSSVMEMTKNRMIKAQLIATIFRQLLAGRSGCAAGQDRLLH